MKNRILLTLACASLFSTPAFAAYDAENPYDGYLFGNWGGMRSYLAGKGIDLSAEYKGDLWRVTSGGIKTGNNYMDNLDLAAEFDNEKLLGIRGNTARIAFVNNFGGKVNETRVGSVEGVDNIETGTNTFKLYEAWVQQAFMDDRVSLLVGLHDLNSEFDVTDMSGNFIKPTFQLGQAFAQTGQNGPNVFPTPGLAARLNVKPLPDYYISAAAFEGIPGDPDHPRGTRIDLTDNEGALLIAEAGYQLSGDEAAPNKLGFGAWRYTEKTDDLVDTDLSGDPVPRSQQGLYMLSSYEFYNDGNSGRKAGAFFRAGISDGDTAQTKWDFETGLVANGLFDSRPDSEIGLGYTYAHNAGKYRDAVGDTDAAEQGIELYYRDAIIPGVVLQPDLQYVINPGTDPAVDNATLVGLRVHLEF